MEQILKKELKLFYLSFAIFNFAVNIVQIFIPIFLFQKGFSIEAIVLFFAVSLAARLVSLPISAGLSSAYGAKKIISFAFFLEIIFFLFLQKVNGLSLDFYASAFFYGFVQAFLWLPFLVHMSKISPDKDRGKISARLNIYSSLASALSPLLGGLAITAYGFKGGFLLAVLFIIPAIILLLQTPEVSKIRKIKFNLVDPRKIIGDIVGNGAFNFQSYLNLMIWPIFIFTVLPEYNNIGFVQTASLVISFITFISIGKLVDKYNRKKVLLLGSFLNSAVGVFRVFASSLSGVFLLNTASIFTSNLQQIPWNVKLQEHMDADARTEYVAIFEVGGTFIALLGLVLFMFLAGRLDIDNILFVGIIIGSLAGLGVNFVRK